MIEFLTIIILLKYEIIDLWLFVPLLAITGFTKLLPTYVVVKEYIQEKKISYLQLFVYVVMALGLILVALKYGVNIW